MVRRQPTAPHRFRKAFRLLAGTGLAAVLGLPLGCAQLGPVTQSVHPTVARGVPGEVTELPVIKPQTTPADQTAAAAADAKVLPINLDTVFRLAEDQNAQVSIARAKVAEAFAEKDVADMAWLPAVNVGGTYYRHEGGISNEDGTLTHSSFGSLFGGMEINGRLDLREAVYQKVNAERQVWQQKGELRKVTSETLLDAANTYIDLLAARTGEEIALTIQKDLEDLRGRAQKLAKVEPGYQVQVHQIEAALRSVQRIVLELREQATRASAKLAYLLGIDPCAMLVPVDGRLVALDLVDVAPPVCDLVARALANGPGIREMEGLLALIHDSMERAKGPGKYLPVFEARMAEGGFGTGPGDDMRWDNRWDLGLQFRWNLTQLVTAADRQRALCARTEQAHLAYEDLRRKLTAGVHESREVIVSGRDQIRLGQEQIDQARQAYNLSEKRQRNDAPRASLDEVLMSLQSLSTAQTSYLNTLRAYDKAQIRLLVLLGNANGQCNDGRCPAACCRTK